MNQNWNIVMALYKLAGVCSYTFVNVLKVDTFIANAIIIDIEFISNLPRKGVIRNFAFSRTLGRNKDP